MNNNCDDSPESSSGRFLQTVRPLRDLESNWTVDLAKNLEEYLLKICSGQISGDDDAIFCVNFAEAALLLQGSVQVYSRKVEYLYSLVLHALDFISQKSQEEPEASASAQRGASGSNSAKDDADDSFWGLDEIPVEPKILLDSANSRDEPHHFVRPPANLVVLEGECLDIGGDCGELESYLLATNDLYRDFILLDSCDAVAVDSFLDSKAGKSATNGYRGSSVASKTRKSFLSPSRKTGESGQKLSVKKKQDANVIQSPPPNHGFESNDFNVGSSPACDFPEDMNDGFGMGYEHSESGDSDDDNDDDPWKPLNPHEPGNLKVKPYKKVKANARLQLGSKKHHSLTADFPLAKVHGPVSTELTEIWEAKFGKSESIPLYEKLRQSLFARERKTNDAFSNVENNTEDNGYDSGDQDNEPADFDMPNNTIYDEDVPPYDEKHEDPDAHQNLEDLCKSHLDALLATLSENEKQNEMATRVSTWKQRIEQNLEEQDSRPPFDIHEYGERVLDKLSEEGDGGNTALSFGDVVKGQQKHDVARTFSALLQLVNNGDVDLVKNSPTPICHSGANPFFVQLLKPDWKKGIPLHPSKRRAKSPIMKVHNKLKSSKGKENNSPPITSPSHTGKSSRAVRSTPEGKKRRKSRVILSSWDDHIKVDNA